MAHADPNWNASDNNPVDGRLIEAKNRYGEGYSITYKTWTASEVSQSPSRLWQVDKVTDTNLNEMSVQYDSIQHSGCWVINKLTLPNSDEILYRYENGFLSEIEYATGEISTFSYSPSSGGMYRLDIKDLHATPGHRTKTVVVSGSASTSGGNVIPTALGVARIVYDGEFELRYLNLVAADNSFDISSEVTGMDFESVIYQGGGQLFPELHKVSQGGLSYETPRRYCETGWSIDIDAFSGGYGGSSGAGVVAQLESSFTRFGGESRNINRGKPDSVIDERDVTVEYTYLPAAGSSMATAKDNLIQSDYSDGTFETYCYNSQNKIVRYRDRNGNVTKRAYNSDGQLTKLEVGLTDSASNVNVVDPYGSGSQYDRCATDDVQTSEYAFHEWAYFSSGTSDGLLQTYTDPNGEDFDYEYDSSRRLVKVTGPAISTGGARPETSYTYDASSYLQKITDPLGHEVEFVYDSRGRQISRIYDDGTTERTIYGTGNASELVVKRIDRSGTVTLYEYDDADRLTRQVNAYAVMDGSTETATPDLASETTYTYLHGTDQPLQVVSPSSLVEYDYDSRGRRVQTTRYASDGTSLVQGTEYSNNQLFSSEDAYGRKTYYAYDATDGRLIRTVSGLTPEFTLADFDAVLNLTRDTSANADYVISDMMYDAEGNVIESYDARLVKTENEYDSRDRQVVRIAAVGTALEARTETDYDAASNVLAVRSPRYFDSSDTEGYQNTEETWTYTPAGQQATHTEAAGTSLAVTETFAYDLLGRQISRTDYGGQTWETHYEDCCGQVIASENPLGHGSIVRKDPMGRSVHQVSYEDFSSHTGTLDDPIDAKTLREVTTKYDGRGRPVARTTWLVARGLVDVTDPPIAGLGSVSAADGLTEQYLYDDDLTDGVGLDNATGVTPLIGSTAVSLADALTKLAGTTANGGAGVSFDADATGSARVTISPEGEVRFSISDGAGRSVMSGAIDDSSDLITWNCNVHDQTESIAGYGTVLASQSVNALGHVRKSLSDAAGRTIQSIDALGKITSYEYDASGNQLKVRDPNGVGQDCLYDALGRDTQCTDTASGVTQSGYDLAGNKVSSTDAKSNTTTYVFDARGRQIKQVDRLSGE
ncbi:RHS repeat protein, partial [Rhodopirellula europaea]